LLAKATGQILTSNQLELDENFFLFRREEIVDKLLDEDEEINILFKASTPIRWLTYDPNMRLGTFKRVSMGSDRHLILQSPTEPTRTAFLSIDQETFFTNLMATTTVHQKAMMAMGPASLTKVKGLPDTIDPTRPPKSFRDAMQREVAQEWAEALNKEYMGFEQRGVFKLVPIQKGMKLTGMTTRWEYKITNGVFDKYRTRLCAMGNQQIAGMHFNESDLYAPALKAHEAAKPWHVRLSTWMEEHGYLSVNTEKTIFMKWEEDDFIIHRVFDDDFPTIPASQKLKDEFEALYSVDFDVTGGGIMTTFLKL
jgi:hypothetical protein